DEPLDAGDLAPVALVRFHDELDPRRVAHELVRAETDGMLLEALDAHLLHVLLRHDPRRRGGQRSIERHEVRPGILEMEAYAVRGGRAHLAHLVAEDLG